GKGGDGIEPDRLVEVRNRAVVFAYLPIRHPAIAKGKRILGSEPDRLAVISNRTVVVAFARIRVASAQKGVCVSGNESDCLAVVGNRSVIVAVVSGCVALAHQGGVPRPHLAIIFFGTLLPLQLGEARARHRPVECMAVVLDECLKDGGVRRPLGNGPGLCRIAAGGWTGGKITAARHQG